MNFKRTVSGAALLVLVFSIIHVSGALADPVPTPTDTPSQGETVAPSGMPSEGNDPAAGPTDTTTVLPVDSATPTDIPTSSPSAPKEPTDTAPPSPADTPSPTPSDTDTSPSPGVDVDTSGVMVIDQLESVPPEDLDAYAAALMVARNCPDDFGYPMILDGVVVLPAVSDLAVGLSKEDRKVQAAQLRAFAKTQKKAAKTGVVTPVFDPGDVAISQIQTVASPSGRNAKQLDVVNNAVFDMYDDPEFKSNEIVEAGIDASGRVFVTVHKSTPAFAKRIAQLFGTRDVVIRVDPDLWPQQVSTRDDDSSPYSGGALLMSPIPAPPGYFTACTAGFSWQDGATQYMLTAGHCAPNGGKFAAHNNVMPTGSTYGTVATNGTMDTWADGVGTVTIPGQSDYHGDLALIKMDSTVQAQAMIYRGNQASSTRASVTSMWNRSSALGDRFCTGGSISGELCGWTVDTINTSVYYSNVGATARNLMRGSIIDPQGTIGGDSGGPVYSILSNGTIDAKGIISGGQDLMTGQQLVWFTDLWEAFYAFPGSVMGAQMSHNPFGNVESVSGMPGAVAMSGWTIDMDRPTTPVGIHVYIGGPAGSGEFHDMGVAGNARSDVAGAYPNAGTNHGFTATVQTQQTGTVAVYVYALNVSGSPGDNTLLWSGSVTIISNSPFGSLSTVTASGGGVRVTGWAVDPDQPGAAVTIYVYVGGPASGVCTEARNIGTAGLYRSDIGVPFGLNVGNYHGFDVTVPTLKTGTQSVYVYALNAAGTPGANTLLGSMTVTIAASLPSGVQWFTESPDMTSEGCGEVLAVDQSGVLWLVPGMPSGQLGAKAQLGTGFTNMQVFGSGDIDSDGRADVLALDTGGDLWLYPGRGAASLATPRQVGNGWTGWTLVAPGDLNGDGKPDLLGIDGTGTLYLYVGKGDGTFYAKKQVGNGWTGWQLYAAGDLNGDGKNDILGIDSAGDLYQYAGKGDGTFYMKVQAGNGWTGFTLAAGSDLTGDGLADITGRDNATGELYFYKGKGSATFAMKQLIATGW